MRDGGKGKGRADAQRETRGLTTVQKFVRGDATLGLSPVPLIVGVSATPRQRFNKVLERWGAGQPGGRAAGERWARLGPHQKPHQLATADKADQAELSMLATPRGNGPQCSEEWAKYCAVNNIQPVKPVLVVQVENGNERDNQDGLGRVHQGPARLRRGVGSGGLLATV